MQNDCFFEVGSLVPPEVAEIKVTVVAKNEPNLANTDKVVLLPLDLSVRGLY